MLQQKRQFEVRLDESSVKAILAVQLEFADVMIRMVIHLLHFIKKSIGY